MLYIPGRRSWQYQLQDLERALLDFPICVKMENGQVSAFPEALSLLAENSIVKSKKRCTWSIYMVIVFAWT